MVSHGKMRTYTTFMMCCTIFFLFADQNILAPNLSAIADDFNMSDSERDEMLGGYIAFGFFVVGGPVALLIGYLADTVNRPILFGLVVAFGESASFGAYWVQNYGELFICRVLTGISIGGATPIIFSMLGDMYPEESRIYVSTLIGISLSAGISGGQLLSGLIGPALGWRAPFLFVAIPALICAALVFFTVSDPPRGDQEQETRRLRELGVTLRQASNPLIQVATSSSETLENGERYFVLEQQDGGRDRKDSDADWVRTPPRKSMITHTYLPQPHSPTEPSTRDTSAVTTKAAADGVIDLDTFVEGSDQYIPERRMAGDHSQHGPREVLVHAEHHLPIGDHVLPPSMEYSEKIDWEKVKRLFYTRSVAIIFIQGFPGCLPWGMIYVFLNDYFSTDRGMTVAAATAALTVFGLGGLAGQLFGGWAGQRLYNRDPRWQCLLMGGTTCLSVIPMIYLLNTTRLADAGFYVMTLIAGFMVSMNGPNVRAVLQNVCTPEVRGSAFAVFSLTDDIGKGLGPALVVLFIKLCNGNRRTAFNIVVMFWLFCGALLLMLTQTVIDDEAAVQRSVREAFANSGLTAAAEGAALEGDTKYEASEHNPLGIHLLASPSQEELKPAQQKHPPAAGYASIK